MILDDGIVERVARQPSDPSAWEALLTAVWPYAVSLAHRRLPLPRRMADAEDVAQMAFAKLAEQWRQRRIRADNAESFLALLSITITRLAIDVGRRATRRREQPLKCDPPASIPPGADDLASPEWADLLSRVERLLTPNHRQLLRMRLEGYGEAEIAVAIGLSERSIRRLAADLRSIYPFLDVSPP